MIKVIAMVGGSVSVVGACLYLAFSPRSVAAQATPMLPASMTIKRAQAAVVTIDTQSGTYQRGGRYQSLTVAQAKDFRQKISQLDNWITRCDNELFVSPAPADLTLEIENPERLLTYHFALTDERAVTLTTTNQIKTALTTPRARHYHCVSLPSWLTQYLSFEPSSAR